MGIILEKKKGQTNKLHGKDVTSTSSTLKVIAVHGAIKVFK